MLASFDGAEYDQHPKGSGKTCSKAIGEKTLEESSSRHHGH